MRLRIAALTALLVIPVAILLVPEGRLSCADPYVREQSPDARWTLTLCRRPMVFAMPGGGSDAPGWIVLRDETDAIRGVSALSMVQLWGGASGLPTQWTPTRVSRPLVTEMELNPATSPLRRWLDDRLWRLRALFRLTPSDEDYS
jgi:hypothetical protein